MASTMVCGPFSHIAGAYMSFAGWLLLHGTYQMTGQSRQIVHRGPWNEETPIIISLRYKFLWKNLLIRIFLDSHMM